MFGSWISEFVIDLHLWFKMSAARREDYELVQEEMGLAKHKFLKHVECRWLSLHPALLRILEQLKGSKKYFLTVLPEKQQSASLNQKIWWPKYTVWSLLQTFSTPFLSFSRLKSLLFTYFMTNLPLSWQFFWEGSSEKTFWQINLPGNSQRSA